MAVVTTRPSSTLANGNSVVVGGGITRHAATSDDNDATGIEPGTVACEIGLTDATIPGTAIVKRVSLRAKIAGGGVAFAGELRGGDGVAGEFAILVNWPGPTVTLVSVEPTEGVFGASVTIANTSPPLWGTTGVFYELYLDHFYVPLPIVDVLAPTGTKTTNVPPVVWDRTLDAEGGGQTAYEVRIFTAAQYGIGGFDPATSPAAYESGIVESAELTHQLDEPIGNATYRAYVRVAQTVEDYHWSAWGDYIGFIVNAPLPGVPSLVLTAQSVDGRIRAVLDDTAGAVATESFLLQRLTADGWVNIRTVEGDGVITPSAPGAAATVYDWEAPQGVMASYRARAIGTGADGPTYSDWTATGTATWTTTRWWLKHPTDPTLNMAIDADSEPGHSRQARQGIFQPFGRADAIVISDTRGPRIGQITLWSDTTEEQAALDAILDTGAPLFIQGQPTDIWTDKWVAFGNQASERVVDKLQAEPVFEVLDWTEVAPPTDNLETWPA